MIRTNRIISITDNFTADNIGWRRNPKAGANITYFESQKQQKKPMPIQKTQVVTIQKSQRNQKKPKKPNANLSHSSYQKQKKPKKTNANFEFLG